MNILIEGNIGIGKSTLLERISKLYNCTTVVQSFEDYPFIDKFHKNKNQYALIKDMVFMMMDYLKIQETSNSDELLICDFSFYKSLIFAKTDLIYTEYNLFLPIYQYLEHRVKEPEVVIYLHGTPNLSLNRIKKRNRYIEKDISIDYLTKLQLSYTDFFCQTNFSKLITIDCNSIDILNDTHFYSIVQRIEDYLPKIVFYRNE